MPTLVHSVFFFLKIQTDNGTRDHLLIRTVLYLNQNGPSKFFLQYNHFHSQKLNEIKADLFFLPCYFLICRYFLKEKKM